MNTQSPDTNIKSEQMLISLLREKSAAKKRVIKHFRKELKSFKLSDNTIQFPLGNPMPKEIVVKLAAFY